MEDKEMNGEGMNGVGMDGEGVYVLGCDEETEFLTMLCETEMVHRALAESLAIVRDKLHRNKMGWKAELLRFRKLSRLTAKFDLELRKASLKESKSVKLKAVKLKSAK